MGEREGGREGRGVRAKGEQKGKDERHAMRNIEVKDWRRRTERWEERKEGGWRGKNGS